MERICQKYRLRVLAPRSGKQVSVKAGVNGHTTDCWFVALDLCKRIARVLGSVCFLVGHPCEFGEFAELGFAHKIQVA